MKHENLSKDILEELYWKRNISTKQIANMFGFKSHDSILYRMKKLGVPRRPSDRKNYFRLPFSGNLIEKAYLVGLRTGDVYARKHGNLIWLTTTSTKETFKKMIKESFGKYAHISMREVNGGITGKEWKITSFLHPSFGFLAEKPNSIQDWILKDDNIFYSFLAGYVDCEGSWIITKHKKYNGKYKDLVFSLGTCDKTILEQIHQKLKELGFKSHLYLVRKAGVNTGLGICNFDLYRVMIMRVKDIIRLAGTLLPLSRHEDKIDKMLKIIELKSFFKRASSIDIPCPQCGYEKLWRTGFRVSQEEKFGRYRCPICRKYFLKKKLGMI